VADIINIQEFSPHHSGEAKCLSCNHNCVGGAEIGSVEFDCPECRTGKGVLTGCTAPDTVWECDCGNQHFYITQGTAMCARCGLSQIFE